MVTGFFSQKPEVAWSGSTHVVETMKKARVMVKTARVLVLAMVALPACGSSTAPEDLLEGGVLATFRVAQEEFRVWVTNEATIQQILSLQDGTSSANIPNGALHEGQGRADHNAPWLWHLDPIDIEMAEATVEVCDGRPSLVDSLLDDYLTVGRFCPWGAELVEVQDFR